MNEYKIILKDIILHSLKEITLLAGTIDEANLIAKQDYPEYFIKGVYLKEFEEFYDN